MKILFVARHGEGDNDPEGAVAHALEELGHDVDCVRERDAAGGAVRAKSEGADLCLFFKWYDPAALRAVSCPKAFWFFDLVGDCGDMYIRRRSQERIKWMADITPLVDVGFCTDGDWVAQDESGKLVQLMQGADGRVAGRGVHRRAARIPILFTGGPAPHRPLHQGRGRAEWLQFMRDSFGDRFVEVGTRLTDRVVRRGLADLIASADVVVAPDEPVTDRYWSNRVYLTAGFGGCMLHPFAKGLRQHYDAAEVPTYYRAERGTIQIMVELLLEDRQFAETCRRRALARTMREHLYLHRVEFLLAEVGRRLAAR